MLICKGIISCIEILLLFTTKSVTVKTFYSVGPWRRKQELAVLPLLAAHASRDPTRTSVRRHRRPLRDEKDFRLVRRVTVCVVKDVGVGVVDDVIGFDVAGLAVCEEKLGLLD